MKRKCWQKICRA